MTDSVPPLFAPAGRIPLKPMSVLTQAERRLVKDLRIAALADDRLDGADRRAFAALPDGLRGALAGLAYEAQAAHLSLFAPGSSFLGDDELAILGGLALLQRPTKSAPWRLTNAFQLALKLCADQLVREDRRLPLRQAFTPAQIDHDCFQLEKFAQACAHRTAKERQSAVNLQWDGRTEPTPGTRKALAVALVRTREAVRVTEFLAIGISRQYLSLLCKWGYLEKAGHGLYRFPTKLEFKDSVHDG
jgi:hypothetical protein